MPNVVGNLLLFASEEDAKKVWDGMQWRDKGFSFKALVPHPATKEECEEKYILKKEEENEFIIKDDGTWGLEKRKKPWFDWYHWHCDKWGCKWDCVKTNLIDRQITFITPWCPPCDKFLQKLANKFNVSFVSVAMDEFETDIDADYWASNKKFPDREFNPQ